jgi:alkylation response protein AidB-like acyl-CoA dehydrogenase
VTLSPDERDELRTIVRSVLAKESSSARVRSAVEEPAGYDASAWRTIAELGWVGLAIPEEHGGAGASFAALGVVLEELGRHVTPGPFLSTAVLGTGVLMDAGATEHLPAIASGELIVAVSVPFIGGDYDVVERDGRLHGTAGFVLDADSAGLIIVAAAGAGGPGLYEVARDACVVEALPTIDMTRRLCRVTFDGVTPDAKLDASDDVLDRLFDRAAVALSADCAGGARRVLEMTVEYSKQREQFGRPIGSFQAIKHRCADLLLLVETTQVAVEDACEKIDGPNPVERRTAASLAKSHAGDAYAFAAGDAIQLHGGIGFTWEHDLHLFLKRAKLNQTLFGDSHAHRERLASMILS